MTQGYGTNPDGSSKEQRGPKPDPSGSGSASGSGSKTYEPNDQNKRNAHTFLTNNRKTDNIKEKINNYIRNKNITISDKNKNKSCNFKFNTAFVHNTKQYKNQTPDEFYEFLKK